MIKDSKHEKFFTRYDFENGEHQQTPKEKQDEENLVFQQQKKEQAE